MRRKMRYIASVVNSLNEQISLDLVQSAEAKGLDLAWLADYMEAVRRGYFLRRKIDEEVKRLWKRPPLSEVRADIQALKRAQEAVKKRHPSARSNRLLEDLRREVQSLSVLLTRKPKGRQMNYWLDYSVYWLAENIKRRTGQFRWELVADLITTYIQELSATGALKCHRRFSELRKDRAKFLQVITSNGLDNTWAGG